MFKGHFGSLELIHDHIDLSYRDPQSWPALTPSGSIRSYTFDIGDPASGPSLQLGLITPVEGEVLDWKHGIDPVHHHGSDQFRVISGGEWVLANRAMGPGAVCFQEAGWVYQEHPGKAAGGAAWMALLMADRRGTISTLHFAKDRETIFAAGPDYGQPPEEDIPYPHPAGHKGLAAVATSEGLCHRGYLYLEPGDLAPGSVVTGVLGDPHTGPVVHVLREPGAGTVIPTCSYATELVFIVAEGSCAINGDAYQAGDLRIQKADCPVQVTAGPNGVELILIVGDRRAAVGISDTIKPSWMENLPGIVETLQPLPGGTWRKGNVESKGNAGSAQTPKPT